MNACTSKPLRGSLSWQLKWKWGRPWWLYVSSFLARQDRQGGRKECQKGQIAISGRYATQIMNEPFPWVGTHGYDHQSLRDERPLSRSDNAY